MKTEVFENALVCTGPKSLFSKRETFCGIVVKSNKNHLERTSILILGRLSF